MSQTPFPEITGLPARVAAIYACAAGAWIALSDSAMALAKGQPAAEMWANTGKGLVFVAVTAGLLYVLLRRSLSREAAIRSDLEATRERFTSAVAQLPLTFAIYDADRRFRFLNARGLLAAHKPLGEVLGRRDEEVFPLELVNAYLPALNRALALRQPQTEVVDIMLPSGHAHLAYTFTPLLNPDGTVRELLAVTNDMTVVVRNNRQVQRLNRTLEAVSAANSVLVRTPDESTLLKEFCEVLAERTGHGLVWVGFTETNGPLRVAVRVGNPVGFLDAIPLACCDQPVQRFCLPDAALKSAQPTVCRDLLLDERFAECREWAQSAGLRSGISLPLRTGGRVFGVLSLYAKEPDRFDGEEVELLMELADDLAFGVVALRQKAELGRMVERLRESEEHSRTLKVIIDQSPAVAYVARAEAGRPVEFMSDSIARFGYQAEEFTSGRRPVTTIIHPEDLPGVVATADKAVANGKTELTVEYRVFDAAGQMRWVQDSCVVVRNATGTATHFRGVLTDITAQRRTAEVLGATYSRYHRLMEQAEDGIALVDVDGRFVEANPAACRLYGRSWEELMGLQLADIYQPDQRHLLPERLLAARDGETFRTERRITRPDGTTVDVEVSWGPVEGILVQGILRDITKRKQAESLLLESQERLSRERALLRTLLDSIPDLIFIKDKNSVYLGCNRAFAAYSGMRENELIGKTDLDIAPVEIAEFYRGKDREMLASGEPLRTEEWIPFKGGGGGQFDTLKTPYYGPNGEVLGLIGISRDVTERQRAESQVRDTLAYLGTLIEASPVGIISYDETGQAQTANQAAARISGATEQQLLAQNFRHVESWKATGLLAAAERALEHHQPEQLEIHDVSTFGKEVWLAAQVVPFQRGGGWHLLLLMTDISEQAQTSAQLRLQSAALDAAANAIVITDAQGTIQWVNPAFTRSTGYTLAEAVGQNPRLLKSGRHPREFYEGMWKTILAGHVWHGEMHNRRKDGTLYDEEMTIAPVRDAAGHVTHFIAIKQDITERKTLEQQFLRAQRMEGIGLLAGGIAHDLNNVLAPILMGADLLKLQTDNEQVAHQLESIVLSARRGADIVKQVLTFARGIEGERALLQPKHIVKEMVRMARETFPRNLQFRVDVAAGLWPVVGDPTQLHQVLLNLSVNARDAMPEGGELNYGARNVEVDAPLAKANPGAKPGPHVVLRVQDTGMGIPPAVLDRIFEPFFTTKELGKGTGLGLSTVLGIVRSHGGFVTVESEPGRGTAFEVYLPANPQAASVLPPDQPELPPRGEGQLILLVDDEADILQVTRVMLERHGYRVLTANDGTIALTQLSQHLAEVKLVVTDILMPFMDGVQLIHALRRLAPQLPVIASSGALGMPGQRDRTDEVLAMDVKHILHKPYAVETLLRAVHEELRAAAGLTGDRI